MSDKAQLEAMVKRLDAALARMDEMVVAKSSRIQELEDAIRGVVTCTKEPGGACVCIQYAETILNKKWGKL